MIRRLFEYIKGMRLEFFAINLLTALAGLCTALIPSFLGQLFDRPEAFVSALLLLFSVSTCAAVFTFIKNRLSARLSHKLSLQLRTTLIEKILCLPSSFFLKHSSGELLSLTNNDINLFRDALSGGIAFVLDMILSLVMVLILMLRMDPFLTLLLLFMLALIFLVNLILTRGVTPLSGRTQEALADISRLSSQAILGNHEIRAYQLEKAALSLFQKSNLLWSRSSLNLEYVRSRSLLIISFLSSLQLIALIFLGSLRVSYGILTMGELASLVLYANSISSPLSYASSLVVDVRRAIAAMRRVFSVLDEPVPIPGSIIPLRPIQGKIDVRDLSFSYADTDKNSEVLKHLSLSVPAGSTAALVGESGCGKTTLMRMIAGFLPLQSGEIRIDDILVDKMDPRSLRSSIALVSQNPFLFQLSVRDNIACGNLSATDEEIEHAARLACAHDFIMRLPDGYQTILGENGANLSGGQRQRLAIARAFLKNAPIILLDEATSALDRLSEVQVQSALSALSQNRTTLIIAHRLSTIRHADCIHYLKNGSILASGTHEELLKKCREYRRMCQTSDETEEKASVF